MIAKSRSGELFGEGSNAVLREKFINYGSESMASYKELEEEIARKEIPCQRLKRTFRDLKNFSDPSSDPEWIS